MGVFLAVAGCGDFFAVETGPETGEGGGGSASIKVINEYVESIFRVSVEGSEGVTSVMSDVRISGNDYETAKDVIDAENGESLLLHFKAMSLGDWSSWEPMNFEMQAGGTYEITYDYDFATGGFAVTRGWN
jgi:hypothetical protein